ncbi:SUKH-4 family immunity protein [Streptomyces sp. NPDC000410]|uniref:SUKH-4 family immunity protein n=1 Tax=Streptomyces sp. NPDC000410 TaxID=3154254 RepID=UPI00331DC8F1
MTESVITVAESELHPAITHAGTRRLLSGAGLPAGGERLRFGALAANRPVPVAELVDASADPGALDAHIQGLLAIGRLLTRGDEAEHIVLDGASGRVFSMNFFADDPDLVEVLPLAPSLEALARFLVAEDELVSRSGRFARFSGQHGVDAVRDATALFLSVLGAEDWRGGGWGSAGDPGQWDRTLPAFWMITALVRPLALMAGPGRGLLVELPEGLLEEEFGDGEIARFDPADLPEGLHHEPTRRFLSGTGLPREAGMFALYDEAPLRPSRTEAAGERYDGGRDVDASPGGLASGHGPLFALGEVVEDCEVVVDGLTGAVHARYFDGEWRPLNADVSTLAFTVWMHQREETLDHVHELTYDMYQQLADTMISVLASLDPVACAPTDREGDWRYWPEVFHDEAGGVL